MVNFKALADTAGDMTPIPVGKVDAVITKVEYKTSGNGKPMWACNMRVQSGPSAGKTFYNNFVVSDDNPNAVRAFFINMRNLGIPQEQIIGFGENVDLLSRTLVGRQAIWTISHREYQGAMRENVDRLDAHPSGPVGNTGGFAAPGAPAAGQAPIPSAAPIPAAAPAPIPQAAPAPAPVPVAAPVPAPTPVPAVPAPPAVQAPAAAVAPTPPF